jgi:hypothetical protein
MKTKKWALIFLLFTGIILFAGHSAFGGCEILGLGDLIVLEGNAPGTKYSGPITIYFHEATFGDNPTSTMYYFMRFKKGNKLYAFAGFTEDVDPLPVNLEGQVDIIADFINEIVVPVVEECELPNCPTATLKSFSLDVSQEDPPEGNPQGLFYYILDIEIGVQ